MLRKFPLWAIEQFFSVARRHTRKKHFWGVCGTFENPLSKIFFKCHPLMWPDEYLNLKNLSKFNAPPHPVANASNPLALANRTARRVI